jgi:hypothetical protein
MNVQKEHILRAGIPNSSTRSHASEEENRPLEIAAKIASVNIHKDKVICKICSG